MATLSTLCETCRRILYEGYPKVLLNPDQKIQGEEPDHASSLQLRQAIELGCFICNFFWENLDDNAKTRLLALLEGGGTWTYTLCGYQNDPGCFYFVYSHRTYGKLYSPVFYIDRIGVLESIFQYISSPWAQGWEVKTRR